MDLSKMLKTIFKNPLFWSILVFSLVVILVVSGIGGVSDSVAEQQKQMLEESVRRSAVQCYAIEGQYPETLNYLVLNYGLFYDNERYVVHYEYIAPSLLPTVLVVYTGDEGERVSPPFGGEQLVPLAGLGSPESEPEVSDSAKSFPMFLVNVEKQY